MSVRLRVTFQSIDIHSDGDPAAGATWRFRMYVMGNEQAWNKDVHDGSSYSLGQKFEVFVPDTGVLTVDTGGYEEDSPGFPLYDDHDTIGGIGRAYRKSDNWGIGTHSASGSGDGISYTIKFTIERLPAVVQVLKTSEWAGEFHKASLERLESKRKRLTSDADDTAFLSESEAQLSAFKSALDSQDKPRLLETLLGRVLSQGWSVLSVSGDLESIVISRG